MNTNNRDLDLSKPWAIHEGRARDLLKQADEFRAGLNDDSLGSDEQSFTSTQGNVRILKIFGPLLDRDSFWTSMGCGISYDSILREIESAKNDPAIEKVLMILDTPGGELGGLFELADYMVETDRLMPIYSHAMNSCCSAGYALASATRRITASGVSFVGGIGVIATLIDDRRAMQAMGYDQIVFVSSISPKKFSDPATEEGAKSIQVHIDAVGKIFLDFVAKRRSLPADTIQRDFGGGDVLLARDALKVGMIDGIINLRDLLKDLENPVNAAEVTGMADDNGTEEDKDEPTEEAKDDINKSESTEASEEEAKKKAAEEDEDTDDTDDSEEDDEPGTSASVKNRVLKAESKRIASLVETSKLYPLNAELYDECLLDGKTTGPEYLVKAMASAASKGADHVKNMNADAAEIKDLAPASTKGGVDLAQAGADDMKELLESKR